MRHVDFRLIHAGRVDLHAPRWDRVDFRVAFHLHIFRNVLPQRLQE